MDKTPTPLKAPPSLPRALFRGGMLFIVDALLFNQGVISAAVGLWLLLLGLPRTFLVEKFRLVRPQRLRNLAVYLTSVILVFAFNAANNRIAQNRAETLVSAVKTFHAKNQRYPKSLQELVPDYIPEVPTAKYTLISSKFWYAPADGTAMLFYVETPPFGRQTYSFEREEWRLLD